MSEQNNQNVRSLEEKLQIWVDKEKSKQNQTCQCESCFSKRVLVHDIEMILLTERRESQS